MGNTLHLSILCVLRDAMLLIAHHFLSWIYYLLPLSQPVVMPQLRWCIVVGCSCSACMAIFAYTKQVFCRRFWTLWVLTVALFLILFIPPRSATADGSTSLSCYSVLALQRGGSATPRPILLCPLCLTYGISWACFSYTCGVFSLGEVSSAASLMLPN